MVIATIFDTKLLIANDKRLKSIIFTLDASSINERNDTNQRELRMALQKNDTLEYVAIYADQTFSSPGEMLRYIGVLQDIGRLPKLRKLHISSRPDTKGCLPVTALIPLLQEAELLADLLIDGLELRGSPADFTSFALSLQGLWGLHRFSMTNCNFVLWENSFPKSKTRMYFRLACSDCALDSLAMSLSLLPSLKTLHLSGTSDPPMSTRRPAMSRYAVSSLFFSQSLQKVYLKNLGFSEGHLVDIAGVLRVNGYLKKLTIGPISNLSPETSNALAVMLESNSVMRQLELILSHMIPDPTANNLARGLQLNRGVESFKLLADNKVGRLSKRCRTCFQTAIQHNYQLKEITIYHGKNKTGNLQASFQRYIKLNALGRGELFRKDLNNDSNVKDWVDKLAKPSVNYDLDAVFYLLSNNPSLFLTHKGAECSRRIRNQGKNYRKRKTSTIGSESIRVKQPRLGLESVKL